MYPLEQKQKNIAGQKTQNYPSINAIPMFLPVKNEN